MHVAKCSPLVVLVAVNGPRQRGVRPGDEYFMGPQSNSKGVHRKMGDPNVRSRTNHDIFAEPEDYDGREIEHNPANGNKIRA